MIQSYLAGNLDIEEREAFETHYLRSGAAQKKLDEARIIVEYFRRSNPRSRLKKQLLAMTYLLLCGILCVVAFRAGRVSSSESAVIARPEQKRIEESDKWLLSQALLPGRTRDLASPETPLSIPPETALLQLHLDMVPSCLTDRCRAELRFDSGPPAVVLPLVTTGNSLLVELPASSIPDQADCLLEVIDGDMVVGSFQFSLKKISPVDAAR